MNRFTMRTTGIRAMSRLIFLCFFVSTAATYGQQLQLSPAAEIHVITAGPYQGELYSAFGHSAVRVHDRTQDIDLLYNYGVFDFDQPNFYLNFTRGHLNYKLAVMDYRRFRDYYIYYNRYIHEQVLNLTPTQKQQYFDFLQWNAQPENQYYLYDYFYDNCATRVRDGLKTTFGDSLTFDGSYITNDYTIRDLTDIYLGQQPWGDLGIDICLGLPMDKTATPEMYMFLPDYIEQAFNHATIKQGGRAVPLVKETIITYESKPEMPQGTAFTPFNVFLLLLALGLVITWLGMRRHRGYFAFDVVLFTAVGLVGWLLLLLWLATDHRAAAHNFNILWAFPLHFPAGILLLKKNKPAWLENYFRFSGILGVLTMLLWAILPQDLHNSLLPLVAILTVRAFYIQWQMRK